MKALPFPFCCKRTTLGRAAAQLDPGLESVEQRAAAHAGTAGR